MGLAVLLSFLLALTAIGISVKTMCDARDINVKLKALLERVSMLDRERLAERVASPAAPEQPLQKPMAAPEPAIAALSRTIAESGAPAAPELVEGPPAPLLPSAGFAGLGVAQIERVLVEKWLVWVGGIALALGGAFLVRLSIERNLLTPIVRIILGVLLGLAMSGVSEWLARRDGSGQGSPAPSYVPQALAAAGAVTVYASFYAAHRLYALLPPPLAFALLAITAGATIAASLRHGAFVAALGLAGAFAVPLLVESAAPHALPLFTYLAIVSTGALLLLRHRAWWWLAWVWLGSAILWVLLWLAGAGDRDLAFVDGFLLIQLILFAALRRGVAPVGFLAGVSKGRMVRVVVRTAFWLIAGAMLVIAQADNFAVSGLVCAFLGIVFLLWFACRDRALDDVIAVAAILPLALLASWSLPSPAPALVTVLPAVTPVQVQVIHFMTASIAAALLFAGVFILLPHVARPGRWAALSAAAPLSILAVAYWRLHGFDLDIPWSGIALALGALELAAASWVARRRTGDIECEIALASYAVGVLGGTILAATFALSNAWLTVTLALHLPALGWVEGRVRLSILRQAALAIAAIVLMRLALNPSVLAYPLSARPLFNWLLYGYGVPSLAFIAATRQFGSRADDFLVRVLEAGAILFTTLLLTLELRHFFYGRIDAPLQSLARDSAETLLWLALAALLLRLGESRSRPVLRWGGVALFGLATLQAVIWQAIIANPLWTGVPVRGWIGLDALTVAYLGPALLYAVIAWLRPGLRWLAWMARALAAGFAFLWLSLEVRHGFRGAVLRWGSVGEAEWYAYSMAWLAFAAGMFATSLLRRAEWLRHLALAVVGLVVAKVFLSDLAQLSGALRALSFLALGAALVGIGYAYRRLRPLPDDASKGEAQSL